MNFPFNTCLHRYSGNRKMENYWAPNDLVSSSFGILSFCLFILFIVFSRQEYWSGLPFPGSLSAGGCEPAYLAQAAASRLTKRGERSFPKSELRGSGLECQAALAQEWPRGATLRLRSVAAGRSYPASEVRGGREEPPRAQGQGLRLGGAPPCARSGAAAGRSNPTSKERWLRGRRRA